MNNILIINKYYFEQGHNNILRFLPDRIRIENYWQKPSRFVLGKTVFRRNHVIADLFSKIHFGEKMGTGFERIKEICEKENSPFPEIEFDENYFYVTFRQSREYLEMANIEKIKEELLSTLNERQKRAFTYIKEEGKIMMKEYIEIGNYTIRIGIEFNNNILAKEIC
ncbi:MAG: ATP-binding protein [Candidatus Humimicrobiaceae bacterium]